MLKMDPHKKRADFVKLNMEADEADLGVNSSDKENLIADTPRVDIYQVRDHMVGSVLSCIFCCTPIGLLAIIRSIQVRDYKVLGHGALAQIASKSARRMIRLAIVFGLLGLLFLGLYLGTIIGWVMHIYNQQSAALEGTMQAAMANNMQASLGNVQN